MHFLNQVIDSFVNMPAAGKYLLALGYGLLAIDVFGPYGEAVGLALHSMS